MNGNFGLLLKPLFYNEQKVRDSYIFIQSYNKIIYDHLAIGYLYLSTQNNKIGLSLPYKPLTQKAFSERPETFFRINKTNTEIESKLISNAQFYIKFKNDFFDHNITIDYNIDIDPTRTSLHPMPKFIIKTNRYSKIMAGFFDGFSSRIIEYEDFIIDVNNKNLNDIYTFYNKINESKISFDDKLEKEINITDEIRKLLSVGLDEESKCYFTNLLDDFDVDDTITTHNVESDSEHGDFVVEEITIKKKPKSTKKVDLLELDKFLYDIDFI